MPSSTITSTILTPSPVTSSSTSSEHPQSSTPAAMTTTTTTTTNNDDPYLTSLKANGFVHIPSLLTPQQLDVLRSAAGTATSLARSGRWPFFRTVPKQFPPWPQNQPPPPADQGGIWGVQHLLHPEMPGRDTFAGQCYFNDRVLGVVRALLLSGSAERREKEGDGGGVGKKDDDDDDDECAELVMELFNLLVSPSQQDFELVWHRDDVRPDVSASEEAAQLAAKSPGGRQAHAQYNIALYDDESLIVVPGSHRRVRTDAERNATPYQTGLPGEITVKMSAGDAVFYDSNILHRGVYRGIKAAGEVGRMTLHGSVGLVGHGNERARQVLQHGVGEWIGRVDAGFEGLEDPKVRKRAEGMRKRLVEMGREKGSAAVGFSLDG